MPEQFHFLQPLWFLALIPMAVLLWWLPRGKQSESSWQHACESHLLPYLLNKPVQALNQLPLWLLAIGWLLAVLALADPVWQKQPQPVYRKQDALVVVMDLSRSMLSADLTPSRLERARFKVADILKKRKEGQTALVVFAGDAFTVAPLSDDTQTILSLLSPLKPDLMPVQGSRADLGLRQAGELLKHAGIAQGDILLITDGYSDPDTSAVAAKLDQQGYRVSVLGVGTDKPAPIPGAQGGFVRDRQGKVVMPVLDDAQLQQLAYAGGGRYHTISIDDTDLNLLLPGEQANFNAQIEGTHRQTDRWQSQGPWLVLPLLLLAALAFRRGWLMVLPLAMMIGLSSVPQPAMAASWDDLWQRHDQRADKALRAGDLSKAQQLAEDPLRRGEAAYRAGDYNAAVDAFNASDTAQGDYNRGNALAQLGRYQDAIKAYDDALAKYSQMADALHNKKELEKLLKQQQDKQNQQSDKDKDGKGQQQTNQQNGNGGKQGKQQQQASNNANDQSKGNKDQQQANQQSAKNGKQDDQNKDGNDQQQARQNNQAAGKQGDQSQQANKADNQNAENKSPQQAQQQNASEQQEGVQAQTAEKDQQPEQENAKAMADASMDTATAEQQQADERWLRRIPDDPGGLLRRKFLYQYSQRGMQQDASQQAW